MRFRIKNTNWLVVGLSSIALHLAVLSTLSAISSTKPMAVTYLPTVQINHEAIQKVSKAPTVTKGVVSGPTRAAELPSGSENYLNLLSRSLSKALNDGLKTRSKAVELILLLEFSEVGILRASSIAEGSGQTAVDSEVLAIVRTSRLYSSPELANLKIQVPVRLR